jgi:hypothetical protein
MLLRFAALIWLIGATSSALAQEAINNGLPPNGETETGPPSESAWIDLRQQSPTNSHPQSAPAWVEAVNMNSDGAGKTIFRMRVSAPSTDVQMMFVRLFFDDNDKARPEIVAWDESGTQVIRSGALGSGIGLPSSDSVIVPMKGISTVDVEVPGDGKNVRAAYLDWMTSSEVVHPANAEHRDVIPEPFSSLPPLHSPDQDKENFGTVTATLANEAVAMGPDFAHGATFQFGIESAPLMALLTFEVASPWVDSPPEVFVNGDDVGPATLTLPELADPAYRGEMEQLIKEMHFQYTGWIRAQKLIPVNSLKVGANDVMVVAGPGTSASAIRGTQVQLKYPWEKLDYTLKTSH